MLAFRKKRNEVIFRNKKNCTRFDKEQSFFKFKKKTVKNFKVEKYFYMDAQIKEMLKISKSQNKTYWISELKDAIYVLYIIKKIRESNLNKRLVYLNLKIKKNFKNIIILGGSGRIGSEITKNLSLQGHQVYVIDKIKNKYLSNDRSIL